MICFPCSVTRETLIAGRGQWKPFGVSQTSPRLSMPGLILNLHVPLTAVVDTMQFDILPYVLFMVVPVLGRMSDPDESMRLLATQTFATLVKLVPLEVSWRSYHLSNT